MCGFGIKECDVTGDSEAYSSYFTMLDSRFNQNEIHVFVKIHSTARSHIIIGSEVMKKEIFPSIYSRIVHLLYLRCPSPLRHTYSIAVYVLICKKLKISIQPNGIKYVYGDRIVHIWQIKVVFISLRFPS